MRVSPLSENQRPPLCLAVHDICTYAKSSLTVVIPVMEALGVEVCPLPTAVLSSQIDGFEDYYHFNLHDSTRRIADCLETEDIKFDCLYSGFLSSPELAYSVKSLRRLLKEDALIAVDPVLGDNGRLYSSFGADMTAAIRSLVSEADIIKPNWTEACLLTDTPYTETPTYSRLVEVMGRLRTVAPRANIALSNVPVENRTDKCNIACMDTNGKLWIHSHGKEPFSLPGSGDFFCSILVSSLLNGSTFEEAVRNAGSETRSVIRLTAETGFDRRHGICTTRWIHTLETETN